MNINENEGQGKTFDQIADEAFGPDKPKTKRNDLYNKFPQWLVDNGVIAIIQPKALRVYCVLLRYADFTTGNGRVGNERISRESGVYISSVPACIKFLEGLGIISTWRKGWVRYYKIRYSSPVDIRAMAEFYKPVKSPNNTDTYQSKDERGRFNKLTVKNNSP